MRISWCDREQAHEVSFGRLHRLLATDPAVGLAGLKGLRGWEQGRACLDIWQMSQQVRAGDWATMAEVGYTGGVNGELWAGMGGSSGEGQEGGEGGDEKGHNMPPPPTPKPLAQAPTSKSAGKRCNFESDESSNGATPPKKTTPPPPKRD